MKKILLIGLPLSALLFAGQYAFSTPEPEEKGAIDQLIWESFPRSGHRLGVVLSDGNRDSKGITIEKILPNSPAEKAGLQKGDVIVRINGKNVKSTRDVREMLRDSENNSLMDVEILRDGNPMTVKVTPEKRDFFNFRTSGRYLGINLQNLDPDLAGYFQVDPNAGILVSSVESNSPAAQAGIRSGDVITHIDGQKVTEAEEVRRILAEGESETIEITVLRHGVEKKLVAKSEQRNFFDHQKMLERQIPKMLESPEFQSEMESLKDQMRSLKDELGTKNEELKELREEFQRELKEEMDKLRKELQQKKNEL